MSKEYVGVPASFTSGIYRHHYGQGRIYARHLKRVFDVAVSLVLIVISAPVIIALWGLTRLDGGPGFFGHKRVGHNGNEFKCWKIRTMVPNAEAILDEHLAADTKAAAEWKDSQKLTNDPRVTRIGNFLRASSLDELPQFWNVLIGEMSMVGPRPIVQDELLKYGLNAKNYLAQKPGVTGPWQISGRNNVSYEERIQFDACLSG